MSTQDSNRVFNFFELEDRILLNADQYDADFAEIPDVSLLDGLIAQLEAADQPDSLGPSTEPINPPAPMAESSELLFDDDSPQSFESAARLKAGRLEIVFIDFDVRDSDSLIDGLRHDPKGATQWHVIQLSGESDGVQQITHALAGLNHVDAVHIISHGDGMGVRLGNSRLDAHTISQHADDIASWAGALDPDADLLLYGCDLAATSGGRELVDAIGILTGRDVASSDDGTGHQSRGGDWDLEYQYGSIETNIAFSASTQQDWTGLLATFTVTNANSTGAGSFSQAIIDANMANGLDTIDFDIAGSGLHSITIHTPLPTITDAVVIDGYTQSGASENTLTNGNDAVLTIELNGIAAGNTFAIDLGIGSDGSIIRGLVINQFRLGGIQISSSGNTVAGNFIGTDSTGLSGLPNRGDGIDIGPGGSNNLIGGFTASEQNIIAFNVDSGVAVATSENANTILRNTIHSNGGLGIDLDADRVTGNDGGSTPTPDQDTGGNGLQNYPVLTSAIAGTSTTIDGSLSSTPGQTFRIEFFASTSADPSGYGEGQRYLGFTNIVVDGTGQTTFSATVASAVASGEVISATATDLATNDTSEFSAQQLATNRAPSLDNSGTMSLTTMDEDQVANLGQTIASIIASAGGDRITDPNAGSSEGIAITSKANGNGQWQYSIDGGSSWIAFGNVSHSSSLLLRDSDRARFVPDGQNQTSASFDFRAWDQTTGLTGMKVNTNVHGGNSSFSGSVETASITVTDVNDAPVLDASESPALDGMYEDSPAPLGVVGTRISSLIDFASPAGQVDNLDEVDIGALPGIAVTAADSTNGSWHYSIDNGATWIPLGPVSDNAARLLAADANTRLYFHPNTDYNGLINNAITFRAWDHTSGVNGGTGDSTINGNTTAFSVASDTASLLVNDAPILDNAVAMTLSTISEDQVTNSGDGIAAIINSAGGDRITDVNFGPVEGIALTATNNGNGTWQYSINGGSSWSNVGTVSVGSSLLLRETDRLRFVPDAENGTPPTVTFRAWDQATGSAGSKVNTATSGGTTPYSVATHTASITVTDVNDAPVLDNGGSMTLTTLNEDQLASAGNTVASVLASAGGNRITDVDFGAVEGIAITSLSNGNGSWQYSIDGGSSWTNIAGVSGNSALLLRQTDSVRFVPNGETGTTASFDFYAWDQFAGTAGTLADATTRGGITPFSIASETAWITVTDINDAPITTLSGGTTTFAENASAVQVDSSLTITDVDSANLSSGQLRFSISANPSPDDRLIIVPGGAVTIRGGNIYHSGMLVGTFAGGVGTSPLTITFNGNSTPSIAQQVGRQVSFFNVSDNPSTAVRTIDATMTDGDGGTSLVSKQYLSVTAVVDAPIAVNDQHGLRFDGIDDVVNMGSNPSLTVTNSLTMEAWIRPDNYPTSSNIILNREGEYEMGITSSGYLRWALANSSPYPGWAWHNTGYVIPLNQWSHVSVVYDNGAVNTYVNGTLVETYHGSGAIGDAHPSLDDFRVGGRQNNPAGQYFSGEIDDVRIWNIARSELEIRSNLNQTLSGAESGLLGYWQFNEGSGNTTADLTANGNAGTLIDGGAGTLGPQWTGYATDQDTPLSIVIANGVTSNDVDGDGDTLTVTHVNGNTANVGSTLTLGSGATVTMGTGGQFSYDPNGAFNFLTSGQTTTDSFTYQVDDGNGGIDTATARVTIVGLNDAPVIATNNGTTVAEGSTGNRISSAMLAAGDIDDAGAGLTFTLTDETDNGTLTRVGFGNLSVGDTFSQADIDAGRVRYNHDDSETISDSFSFLLFDGGEDGSLATTGTFTFAVTLVNDHSVGALIDIDTAANIVTENAATGTIVGVTAMASDGDINDSVSYTLDDDAGGRFSIGAATGTVTVSGPIDFETSANENITIRATSTDGSAVTIFVSISVTDINESPSAIPDSFSIFSGERLSVADPGVVFNDSDVDGDVISTLLVTPPSNGTFSLQPGGAFVYTPDIGFFGRDAFYYQVTDGSLSSNIVKVSLDVIAGTPTTTGPTPTPEFQTPTENPFDSDSPDNTGSDSDSDLALEESNEQADTTEQSNNDSNPPAASALTAPPDPNQNAGNQSQEMGSVGGDPRLPLELTGEAERQFFGAYGSNDGAAIIVQSDSPEIQQLERILRQDLQQAIVWSQWDSTEEQKETPAMILVGAAGAGMSLFSISYVFWALRGGALMTVFASSLPAWRFIDPIAMLSAYRRAKTNGDEQLDSLMH